MDIRSMQLKYNNNNNNLFKIETPNALKTRHELNCRPIWYTVPSISVASQGCRLAVTRAAASLRAG